MNKNIFILVSFLLTCFTIPSAWSGPAREETFEADQTKPASLSPNPTPLKKEIDDLKEQVAELKKQVTELKDIVSASVKNAAAKSDASAENDAKSGAVAKLEKQMVELKDIVSTSVKNAAKSDASAENAAKPGALENLAFSGFFDINVSNYSERDNPWAIGPVELDLEFYPGDNFAAAGALVFENGAADVGVAFIDYHSFDSKISPRGRIFYDPGFHLQLGRFDVPFGLDYLYFATPDRETITSPLITDYIMDGGWNDDGLRFYGTYKFLDYSAYTTNGFNEGVAYGGRLGVFPFRNPFRLHKQIPDKLLGLGLSLAADASKQIFTTDEFFWGVDLEFTFKQLEIRSEYLQRDNYREELKRSGFYVTGKFTFETLPVYAIINFDEFKENNSKKLRRLSFGVTHEIPDYATLKLEYLRYLNNDLSVLGAEVQRETFSGKVVLSF